MSNCLIIIGMHRSGTSLTSSILQRAGLDIGSDLLSGYTDNKFGHFENMDFLKFHAKILGEKGFYESGLDGKKMSQLDGYKNEAELIIEKNATNLWGWKEPRTTLFIDFWKELIPNAKFLFVYRNPSEVLDSLYRRNDFELKENSTLALESWTTYNNLILDEYLANSSNCFLINIDDVAKDIKGFINQINKKFSLTLNCSIESPVVEKEMKLKPEVEDVFKLIFPEAYELYGKLILNSSYAYPLNKAADYQMTKDSRLILLDYWFEYYNSKKIFKRLSKLEDIFGEERTNLLDVIRNMEDSIFWKIRGVLRGVFGRK